MTARHGAVLYTPEILALAVELARFPLDESLPLHGEAQSRVCGGRVAVAIDADAAGSIVAIGARVSACAVGQAAAALFLKSSMGRDAAALTEALNAIERWLGGDESAPDWPGIAMLAAARDYRARHAAILLPWRAALAALSNRVAAD